jgi:hypothetical protein
LEAVEAACLRNLDLSSEPLSEVFENYAIRGGKESEDVLDKMALILGESLPILDVLGEVHFLSSPECGLLVLVHPPDVVVLNGKEHKAVGVLL